MKEFDQFLMKFGEILMKINEKCWKMKDFWWKMEMKEDGSSFQNYRSISNYTSP